MKYLTKWNRRNRTRTENVVCGVFKAFDAGQVEIDSEDEDEEEEISFLNYKEINSSIGGNMMVLQGKKQRKIQGTLVDQNKKTECFVQAGLHLTDPWWKITLLRSTKGKNHMYYQKDSWALAYEVLDENLIKKNNIIYQYLTKFELSDCGVVEEFYDFVCKNIKEEDKLTFTHLKDLIEKFEDHLPEERKGYSEALQTAIRHSEAELVYKAMELPLLFNLIPQILPLQFISIVNMNIKDLISLNKDLNERPWVFGFRRFLFKDHHIVGCEASWNTFEKSGLENKVEQPYKDALLIYDFLKEESRNGHTGTQIQYIKQQMSGLVYNFQEAFKFLKRNKIVKEETINHIDWIFLYHLYKAEEYISKTVSKLYKEQMKNKWILDVDLETEEFSNIRGDADQVLAAKLLTQLPVVAISGKGGCGKTTVVTKVMSSCDLSQGPPVQESGDMPSDDFYNNQDVNQYNAQKLKMTGTDGEDELDLSGMFEDEMEMEDMEERDLEKFPVIIYTAPTGKAANLLGKRARSHVGYTLHQVIWSYRSYLDQSKKDSSKKWKFKNVNTLVVDECSLVAVTTFSTLFRMLIQEARLRRIVLLGDVRQLPSIEPGNFLSDMFAALQQLGCAVELKTNHRSESELIVNNAGRISYRQYPVFDPDREFKLYPVVVDAQNNFINPVIWSMLRKERSLRNDRTSQFVAFRNKDIDVINEICCQFYNKHAQKDDRNKKMFRTDDKICMTKNGYVIIYDYENGEMKAKKKEEDEEEDMLMPDNQNETIMGMQSDITMTTTQKKEFKESCKMERLCNGEIFFIKDDKTFLDTGKRYLLLSNEDPDDLREFWVYFKEIRRMCKPKHSWARTIHTFQGSESDTVVYVLGGTVSWQNWQHVYTAVTRGKKSVYIVGPEQVLQRAIQTQPQVRWTSLHYQLKQFLPSREDLNCSIVDDPKSNSPLLDASLPFTQTNSFCLDAPEQEEISLYTKLKPKYQIQEDTWKKNKLRAPALALKKDECNSQQAGPSGLHRTLSPSVSQNISKFLKKESPVQQVKDSNDSQWSEIDESLLLFSEEDEKNEIQLQNDNTMGKFCESKDQVIRRKDTEAFSVGKKLDFDSHVIESPSASGSKHHKLLIPSVKAKLNEDSDATQSPDSDQNIVIPTVNMKHNSDSDATQSPDLDLNLVIPVVNGKLNSDSDAIQSPDSHLSLVLPTINRKHTSDTDETGLDVSAADVNDFKASGDRRTQKDLATCCVQSQSMFVENEYVFDDKEDGDLTRLCMLIESKQDGSTESNTYRSPTLIDDSFEESDGESDGSCSLLSSPASNSSHGKRHHERITTTTPKKQKFNPKDSFFSPTRRRLDNLSVSKEQKK